MKRPAPHDAESGRHGGARRPTWLLALCAMGLAAAVAQVPAHATTLALTSSDNPSFVGATVSYFVTVAATSPTGTVRFDADGAVIAGCAAVPLSGSGNFGTAMCATGGLAAGDHLITATYPGDPDDPPASVALTQAVAPRTPGIANIVTNPYGPMSVQGATLVGNTISNMTSNVVIRLGKVPGAPGAAAQIDFQGFNLATGGTLDIQAGAPGQVVIVVDTGARPSVIGGGIVASYAADDAAPLYFRNPNGITITTSGAVAAQPGVSLDTLGATWSSGGPIVNQGVLDGGDRMELLASNITGNGEFRGNSVVVHTFGNANNPVYGAHYLQNGLRLFMSANNVGMTIALTLNAYGSAPQVLNFDVHANATVWMPSAWSGTAVPPNNPVVPAPNGIRRAGVPDPAYGGGSMIVQASLSLALVNGDTHDFVFPGAIVLKAVDGLDLNGVVVNQGWTTSGRSFQGVFLEAPNIFSSSGLIEVYGNDLNWINFSTFPNTPVRAFALVRQPDGSATYAASDATAPHLNTYSTITSTAADGGCWTCLISANPVNMFGP